MPMPDRAALCSSTRPWTDCRPNDHLQYYLCCFYASNIRKSSLYFFDSWLEVDFYSIQSLEEFLPFYFQFKYIFKVCFNSKHIYEHGLYGRYNTSGYFLSHIEYSKPLPALYFEHETAGAVHH